MKAAEEAPRPEEVLSELERVLDNHRFKTAATQSNILRFVVSKALSNETIKGSDIRGEMPGYSQSDSHKERANATVIRRKLKEYYENEGRDNLVRIGFPPGPAYRPTFSFQVKAEAILYYRRGLAEMERGTFHSLANACANFLDAVRSAPAFDLAYAAYAEAVVLGVVLRALCGLKVFKGGCDPAFVAIANALRYDNSCWLAQTMLGSIGLFNLVWDKTGEQFLKVSKLNTERSRHSLWVATYFFVLGDFEMALGIVSSRVESDPTDAKLRVLYALFLYSVRRYGDALEVLDGTDLYDLYTDFASMLRVLIFLATDRANLALAEFIGDLHQKHAKILPLPLFVEDPDCKNDRFWGLTLLSLSQTGQVEEAKEHFRKIKSQQKGRPPIQLAFAYMAVGQESRAVAAIRKALFEEHCPVALAIPFLPIFDSLRANAEFDEMVTELRELAQVGG